jgi:hypothetical protein
VVKTFTPDKQAVKEYAKIAERFRGLYPAIRDYCHAV